ncbi:SURF1 family cytochrome oxidase biogenesis protein [Nocardioides coralli]|uniref:SURF1 family cytochrome oxidase biogenesis protein n=1 Tax=Nocardioides coralli TaxID=2872154 RepID=UPI001CA3AFFD|nr:SURF1 family protein [Nocardioides coralli]QZY27612.1 SURF1 family protein [Nocardioides coralli]
MRSWRFLVSRRWVGFALVVALLAAGAWWLGEWQFSRLEERQLRNDVIQRNEAAPPAPVAEVVPADGELDAEDEWRTVTATGTYAAEETVIVRYRTRDGASGVEVVVPLVLDDGTAVLVDRGWLATDNRAATPDIAPRPPAGEVSITGWARRDSSGESTVVSDRSTRAISSEAIGEALDRDVLDGFVALRTEDPAPDEDLARTELPELDDGPHFFYGLQWWFFGLLALFGFGYLAWDERRGPRTRRSQRAEHAPVDREHHAAHE